MVRLLLILRHWTSLIKSYILAAVHARNSIQNQYHNGKTSGFLKGIYFGLDVRVPEGD